MWWEAIRAAIAAFFGALFAALRTRRQDAERDTAITGKAVDDAALETQEAINETALERESLPEPPSNRDDLIRELRKRAGSSAAAGRDGGGS